MTDKDKVPETPEKSADEIVDEIKKLNKQMAAFARDGLYQKADANLKIIEELKKEVVKKRREAIIARHVKEVDELKLAFDQLKIQFNTLWDDEIKKFDLECSRQILSMEVCVLFE
jgi:hypothetical protein